MPSRLRFIAHLRLHAPLSQEQYVDALELLTGITPHVQPFPPDAMQLDLTSALRFFDRSPLELLQMVQLRLMGQRGIPTSAGLAPNRMLAAMAASETPRGRATHVPDDQGAVDAWLRPHLVTALPDLSRRTVSTLRRYGLHTVGDVADLPPAALQRLLGAAPARALADRARGLDPRPVTPQPTALRATADKVFDRDVLDPAHHHRAALDLAEQLGIRLRAQGQLAGRLTLALRYADRSTSTRSRSLAEPTAHSPALADIALGLLDSHGLQRARVRGYALSADDLRAAADGRHQLSLDPADDRARRIEAVADRARSRFGQDAVRPGTLASGPRSGQTVGQGRASRADPG